MARYRHHLPQLEGGLYLTDAGLETSLIFLDGLDLPYFAAFHLLKDAEGRQALRRYFRRHVEIARRAGSGFILESATWRASPDWGVKLGYSEEALTKANIRAVGMLAGLREELETGRTPMVISGCIGPRGDGYAPGTAMTPAEAEDYHGFQASVFAGTEADMVTAITMTNAAEATGLARAARAAGLPVAISFTVETDGRLPTGQPLPDAIAEVDAATGQAPAYYMVNCAHPTHFADVFEDAPWLRRMRGVRANASKRSHAELDASPDLDAGNPSELAEEYAAIRARFPWIHVLGGCCGTDHRHIEQIADACLAAA
jgi:S-methylmethionine-dependent homocysteine/selenocysteine methylase